MGQEQSLSKEGVKMLDTVKVEFRALSNDASRPPAAGGKENATPDVGGHTLSRDRLTSKDAEAKLTDEKVDEQQKQKETRGMGRQASACMPRRACYRCYCRGESTEIQAAPDAASIYPMWYENTKVVDLQPEDMVLAIAALQQKKHEEAEAEAEVDRLKEEAQNRMEQHRKRYVERQEAERQEFDEEVARLRKARKTREEEERANREAERIRQEKETLEAKAKVEEFLKAKGFKGVNAERKKMMSTTYPLHTAVKENNAEMVALLIRFGANVNQKNSSGQTAPDAAWNLAWKSKEPGSYNAVLAAVRGAK